MAAARLNLIPDSLYNFSVSIIVTNYDILQGEIKCLPISVQCDVFFGLYNSGSTIDLCHLYKELSNLKTFLQVLEEYDKRSQLHRCFQTLMDSKRLIGCMLVDAYTQTNETSLKALHLAFNLGSFLFEAGWHLASEHVYHHTLNLAQLHGKNMIAQCLARLMASQSLNCRYRAANTTWKRLESLIARTPERTLTLPKVYLKVRKGVLKVQEGALNAAADENRFPLKASRFFCDREEPGYLEISQAQLSIQQATLKVPGHNKLTLHDGYVNIDSGRLSVRKRTKINCAISIDDTNLQLKANHGYHFTVAQGCFTVPYGQVKMLRAEVLSCQMQSSHMELLLQDAVCQNSEVARRLLGGGEECKEEELDNATLAFAYSQRASMAFSENLYQEGFHFATLALCHLRPYHPPRLIVDVFCQLTTACVLKRLFDTASVIIKFLVPYAREIFGVFHPKFADVLMDYAFFLLNVDSTSQAVETYGAALNVRTTQFGGNNLEVAGAHEDLAYAMYVYEYSSGNFEDAKEHAESALDIISKLLPEDHLARASANRVKALILEEVAIDSQVPDMEQRLLDQAHTLHQESLQLVQNEFGENNVQTAKHYGNLGRLYQSMKRYKEAEAMHLRAISIKENLLGPEDYEVALSLGHLASLYNYDLEEYTKAEGLYLRSVQIGKKLFGVGYSGLEYDYRGLIRLYTKLEDVEKVNEFLGHLHQWTEFKRTVKHETPCQLQPDPEVGVEHVIRRTYQRLVESGAWVHQNMSVTTS